MAIASGEKAEGGLEDVLAESFPGAFAGEGLDEIFALGGGLVGGFDGEIDE